MRPRTPNDIHVVRLRMLRDVAVPFIREVERQGSLDFDVYMDRWRLKGCMLGWMALLPSFQADGWSIVQGGFPSWQRPDGRCETGFRAAREYFGLSEAEVFDIFGVDNARSTVRSRCPTLGCRVELIDVAIRERSEGAPAHTEAHTEQELWTATA